MRVPKACVLLMVGLLMGALLGRSAGAAEQKLRLEVYADFDYNTNATQQPGGADAQLVTGQGSPVLTQGLKAEYNFNPAGPFDVQLKYDLFNNFYTRIGFIDTLMHTWTLSPSYSFGASRNIKFWLPFSFNYTDVGSDKYFTSFVLRPNLFHRFSQHWGYSVELRLTRRYGWIPQFFPRLYDYTSRNTGASLGLYYFLDNGGYLQARLSYEYVGAEGSNIDHSAFSLLVSGEYPITKKLNVLLYLDLALRPYDHVYREFPVIIFPNIAPFPFPTQNFPKREDKILTFGALVEYKIYKGFIGSVHYYVTRWDSNIPLYDFTSHIFGGQLAYRY